MQSTSIKDIVLPTLKDDSNRKAKLPKNKNKSNLESGAVFTKRFFLRNLQMG
jgi:hypothetical protein